MATNATQTTSTDTVALDAELFDTAFGSQFGPFEDFSTGERERMSQEFATAFPALNALLEGARASA